MRASVLTTILSLTLVAAHTDPPYPHTIDLPPGIEGEGIATGEGTTFYAGSLSNGQIVSGDLRAGTAEVWVTDPVLVPAVGLSVDVANNLLFVAGGPTGQGAVYDTGTAAAVEVFTFTTDPSFINDVIVTRDAAYFTNSAAAELYRVPIGPGGALGSTETIALSGPAAALPGDFNLNGIEATANGKTLIAVNSTSGALFAIDPASGESATIDLGTDAVPTGDGVLIQGKTLYVLQNGAAPGVDNQVAVIKLAPDLASGEIVDIITDDAFETATTLARHGTRLAAVNAQFLEGPVEPFEVVIFRAR
jgi:hypothetical protein